MVMVMDELQSADWTSPVDYYFTARMIAFLVRASQLGEVELANRQKEGDLSWKAVVLGAGQSVVDIREL